MIAAIYARTSAHYTSDEVQQNYVAKMGDELGSLFNRFYNECAWLHLKRDEYEILFGTKQSRVDLLNSAASGFFRVVQTSLWEDVLLHICRLTDDPTVGRRNRETLSVRRLPALVEPTIRLEIKKLVSAAVKKSEFARDWRDRHIAHRDLRLALKQGATPLAGASRQGVRKAVDAITAVLGAVEGHYCKATTAYEHASQLGNAEALLHVLRDGIEAREELHGRLRTGQTKPDEFRPRLPV